MVRCETELYQPVASFLTERGYTVRGEVKGCDVTAVRGDELLIVELKRTFNLDLVLQGVERQALTESVYLATEELHGAARRRWRRIMRLCRQLGLGLMMVRFRKARTKRARADLSHGQPTANGGCPWHTARVEVMLDPAPYKPRLQTRKRGLLLEEFAKRSADHNVGGCVRTKVVTAYREEALRLAYELRSHGPASVKELRDLAESAKAQSILYKNFYGWFEHVDRGQYQLTSAGIAALDTYAHVLARGA
jgi:hypothetical protein